MNVEIVDERRTRELRRTVLRPNLAPDAPMPGDDLPAGVHWAALAEDGSVLGTCFVHPDPCPWWADLDTAWRLRQMATADGHRRQGVGSAVLGAAIAYLRGQGAPLVWCNAREGAVAFYRRHGFAGYGGLFTDERHQIPHLRMWRELFQDPATSH